jgi:2-aminoethylphosphonate-pyruvate transaminase
MFQRSYHLLCPGPVNVDPEVSAAMSAFAFSHREEEFEALLDQVIARILGVAGVDPAVWSAVVLTGSGTAANEAVLASATSGDAPVLVLANGEFGERLGAISEVHNPRTTVLRQAWGTPFDLDRVAQAIRDVGPALVAMVQHETSTGMLNPVAEVGRLVRDAGAKLFVDAVSSFSADALDFDASGVSFVSTSSGKALGCYPGLSIVVARHADFETIAAEKPRAHYLDLGRYYRFARDRRQTPNTPAVPLLLALDRALELVLREGRDARRARFESLARIVRDRLRGLGLELLLEDWAPRSNVLTTALLPEDIDYGAFRAGLKSHGFVTYGGKGPLEGRAFQVSTVGAVDSDVLEVFFQAIGATLATLRGEGSRASMA